MTMPCHITDQYVPNPQDEYGIIEKTPEDDSEYWALNEFTKALLNDIHPTNTKVAGILK